MAGSSGAGRLEATFTPEQSGFHLYSVDLPPDGVQGVGRPTTVAIGGALVSIGPPTVDRTAAPLRVSGLDAPVPVYPDGPVTLRLAVRLLPAQAQGTAPVQGTSPAQGTAALAWVSYAACSPQTCLPPVTHRQVGLTIPALS